MPRWRLWSIGVALMPRRVVMSSSSREPAFGRGDLLPFHWPDNGADEHVEWEECRGVTLRRRWDGTTRRGEDE
jgi:hypothetical protein